MAGAHTPEVDARRRAGRVVELTDQMVACARRGDWAGVVERNRLRDAELRALFQGPVLADEEAAIRDALEYCLRVEGEARDLMIEVRDELGEAAREQARGRTGSDAYNRFA